MVKLALYKKAGTWINRVIRWRTQSAYSHCELVIGGRCYSSSGRDDGVRGKLININDGGWDVIELPWVDAQDVLAFYEQTQYDDYDYLGAILGRAGDVKLEDREAWFCSEWCAAAIGFSEAWRFTPATLAAALAPWLNVRGCIQ